MPGLKRGDHEELKSVLDIHVERYNRPEFIETDPVSVPHRFKKRQDIEISGFLTATLAWGQRRVIISKSLGLMELMDFSPHDFVINHKERDLKPFLKFRHRTFNATDILYFIHFFRKVYRNTESMESLFLEGLNGKAVHTGPGIDHFRRVFADDPHFPGRTGKHVSSPERKSACKRINMFLRWMVRRDQKGVDFGLWRRIKPSQLICPLDVHVGRVAGKLGLLTRKQRDWQAALELTRRLKMFDPEDPVKYDFALFGMSAFGGMG